jgi:uncharacterized protein with gpF-like domain
MSTLFFQQVKAYRRSLTKAQRSKPIRTKAAVYPAAVERRYSTKIESWLLPITDFVEKYIQEKGKALLRGDTNKDLRMDAVAGEEFDEMKRQLDAWMKEYYPTDEQEISKSEIMLSIGVTATTVCALQSKIFSSQAKPIVGFDYITPDPWWEGLRDRWMADNYRLIKSLSTEYITKVNLLVDAAIDSGTSYADLTKQIQSLSENITKKRARLIARDQIGKLQGQINQKKQMEAGVETYYWQTAGDERVRGNPTGHFKNAIPSHYVMNDVLCRWDDASVYSKDGGKTWINRSGKMPLVHPGQAIQCRCSAIPNFDDIVQEVDEEIAA